MKKSNGASIDVLSAWQRYKAAQYTQAPCHTNRASQLGGDCERELVYQRTHWREAALPPLDLRILLQEGEKHEREVLMELQRAGVQVIEQQCALAYEGLEISGHIDATVVVNGESIPVDVKSMAAHIWTGLFREGSKVYEWDDVCEAFSRRPWLRKYLAQMTLYALMKGEERGLLLCINKGTGALAQVVVELDYGYAETLLQRAERINAHVRRETLPERIPFDEEVCPRCPFYALCLPDHQGREPIAFLDDAVVEGLLEDRAANELEARAFRKADERLKAWAKARPEDCLTVGRWFLRKRKFARGVRVEVQAVEAPQEVEAG